MQTKFSRATINSRLILGLVFCLSVSRTAHAQDIKVTKDVVYTEATDPKEGKVIGTKLDVYLPQDGVAKHPSVILIHGGGWFAGDKGQYKDLATELAKAGFVAFSLNYRLAPKFQYPAALDDVQHAVRWVRAHATEYTVDGDRLGALGDSAGAHLAAFLGLRDTRDNSDKTLAGFSSRVKCVVDLYPPTDFTGSPEAAKINPAGLAMLQSFFGKKPEDAPDLYKDGSPITFVDKSASPFLIFHGDADKLVPIEQSKHLHDALKKVNVESTFVIFANEGHGFQKPGDLAAVKALTLTFFNRILKGN